MELITLIGAVTVFILAIFLGFELITKVPPTLHTPLMSGANAISGITIVGALIFSNTDFNGGDPGFAAWLAFFALLIAVVGAVYVYQTDEMPELSASIDRLTKPDADIGKYGPRSGYMIDEDE